MISGEIFEASDRCWMCGGKYAICLHGQNMRQPAAGEDAIEYCARCYVRKAYLSAKDLKSLLTINEGEIDMADAPIHKIKQGLCEAAGWVTKVGTLSWRFKKRYFNKGSGEWQSTETFFLDDLHNLKILLDIAIEKSREVREDLHVQQKKETTEW